MGSEMCIRDSASGYASETTVFVEEKAAAPGAPAVKKPKSLSKDFVKK